MSVLKWLLVCTQQSVVEVVLEVVGDVVVEVLVDANHRTGPMYSTMYGHTCIMKCKNTRSKYACMPEERAKRDRTNMCTCAAALLPKE